GRVRPTSDHEDARLRARPRPDGRGPVHGRGDRHEGKGRRLQVARAGRRDCPERAVPLSCRGRSPAHPAAPAGPEKVITMTPHEFPITRRTMLRGVGAALALPWLEAR